MTALTRRDVALGIAALSLAPTVSRASAEGRFTDDYVIGDENAPVTVYEYVSYTCGYCARFHNAVWPEVKEKYVDTGMAKFVLRGFYRNTTDLDVGLLSRCGGEETFYTMADSYLSSHSVWTRSADINLAVAQVAKRNGMPQSRIDACLADFDFKKALVERFREQAAEHRVESTPTFVIGGTTHAGLMSAEDLGALIEAEMP